VLGAKPFVTPELAIGGRRALGGMMRRIKLIEAQRKFAARADFIVGVLIILACAFMVFCAFCG